MDILRKHFSTVSFHIRLFVYNFINFMFIIRNPNENSKKSRTNKHKKNTNLDSDMCLISV